MATILSTKTSGVGGLSVTGDASGVLELASANGTTAVTIDASQNVGIGTSSLSNGVRTVIQGTQTGGAPQTSGTAQTYGLLRLQGTSFTSVLDFGTHGGNYNWIQATDNANLATNYSLALNPNGGNVGIGTSSPSKKLSINGDFRLGDGGGTGAIFTDATVGLRFMLPAAGTSTTESMRIDSSGNLLVGTTTAAAAKVVILTTGNASASMAQTGTTGDHIYFRTSTTNLAGYISSPTGSTVSYISVSDQRLKENIVDAPSALNSINAIKVRSFDWKVDGIHQDYGYIAQELLKVAPEAVAVPSNEDEMMGVDFGKLTPRLVKAIQEQQTLIEALTARLTALEAK